MYSVLLSVYSKERPEYLHQCFESLLSQTLLPKEIVLVKDGSLTNDLENIIEIMLGRCSIIRIVALPVNQGLGIALNEGLKNCSSKLIARMDTDDIAKPNRFEKQIKIFQKYPDLDVVGAWIDEFENDTSNIISTRKLPEFNDEIIKYAKQRNPINHPAVMFRKHSVLKVGGYKHFPLFEDYYLWVRMIMNGAKFYNIQESLLYFRFSPDMFKRRGGLNYAIHEYNFQRFLKNEGFISQRTFIKNTSLRFISRIIPNSLRSRLYKKILRK